MKKILIFGSGGHSKVIVDIIQNQGIYKILGFIDNKLPKGFKVLGYKVIGNDDDIDILIEKYQIYGGSIAIGDNFLRSLVIEKVKEKVKEASKDFQFINCIHPKSHIALDVKMGEGNVLMPGAVINTSSEIGSFCILNTNSSIDHDNKFSDFVSVGPNAVCGGNVAIDKFSAIGIGATVINDISIAQNCIIGANSLVNKNTKSNSVYYGQPAKYIREHKFGDKYL